MRRIASLLAAFGLAGIAAAQTPGELPLILGRGGLGAAGKSNIAFVSSATTQQPSGAVINATVPATQSGDGMVALVFSYVSVSSPPAGWTRIANATDSSVTYEVDVYYRVSTGASEPATYSWTGSNLSVQIRDYRFMNANPLDGSAGSVNAVTTTANCQIPSMSNTAVDNELYLGFWANDSPANNVITPPPGMNNIASDGSWNWVLAADQIVGPAGSSVAPRNATFAQTGNGCIGVTLKPQ